MQRLPLILNANDVSRMLSFARSAGLSVTAVIWPAEQYVDCRIAQAFKATLPHDECVAAYRQVAIAAARRICILERQIVWNGLGSERSTSLFMDWAESSANLERALDELQSHASLCGKTTSPNA